MPMKSKIFTFFIILIFSAGCSASSSADIKEIEAVKRKLTDILPNEINLISIQETDLNGFYEVIFEGIEPLYVSSDGNYLVSGDIYLITKDGLVNKSESRRDYQRKTLIGGLNESELITFEPRQINHNIFVFTDVDCGYCRQFHNQIDDYLELGIKVNYLAYPRAGIGSDSFNKISSAWCNEDPNFSLTLLKQGQDIETNLCEDNPVEKHFNLGNTIGVQGTPSIITDEGKMIPGYLPPQDLLNILGTNS
jgi:thiol:disulfide interchange protein DsbC